MILVLFLTDFPRSNLSLSLLDSLCMVYVCVGFHPYILSCSPSPTHPPLYPWNTKHAWDQPLHDVIDAIVRSEVEGPFWISALSVYQNDDEEKGLTVYQQMGSDPKQSALVTVLDGVECMLAVVTLGYNLYERLW